MIRETVAIASWVVLTAVSLLPDRMRPRNLVADNVLIAVVFVCSAAVTRYWLQETRTREQILAFALAAVVLALLRIPLTGRALSLTNIAAGVGGAAVGAILVKFRLEGLPS